jgi:hypothetical protein
MEKFLESYRVSSGTKSAATMRAMQMSIRRIEKIFDRGFDDWTIAMFKEVDEIVSKVNDGFSLSTSISTILAIRQYLKYKKAPQELQDKYTEVMNTKANERKDNNTNQSKSEINPKARTKRRTGSTGYRLARRSRLWQLNQCKRTPRSQNSVMCYCSLCMAYSRQSVLETTKQWNTETEEK